MRGLDPRYTSSHAAKDRFCGFEPASRIAGRDSRCAVSALSTGARLLVVEGPGRGRSLPLAEGVLTIGRQDSSDLQVRDASVSRRHCEILAVDGGYELRDSGSTQGSFVNRRPVRCQALSHGDFVQVGKTLLLFLDERNDTADDEPSAGPTGGSTIERSPSEIAQLLRGKGRGSEVESGFLLEIAAMAQQARTAQTLAEGLLDSLLRALPVDQGLVLPCTPGARPWASRGEALPSRAVLARVREHGVALWWDALSSDPGLDPSESLLNGEICSVLAAPLAGRRELHGVLYLQGTRKGVVGEHHLAPVATAAALAGLALDTMRELGDLREENRRLRGEHGLVGESAAMKRVLDFIDKVGPVDSTVLLLGESGTGKELVASALHRAGPRSDGPFVAINCATLSETLLESDLFGHERGAFTGAVGTKIGKFEAAHGGTLFLDEVAEMPVGVQARLLRALQERRFERVGGTRPVEVDVRVIAATHRDLEQAMGEGQFRRDLFYRLNVITCQLPPLRERRQDIPLLVRHLAHRLGERLARPGVSLEPAALRALTTYDWPGNVRQLSNAVERALVLGDGERLRVEDLPDEVLERASSDIDLGDYQAAITETKKRLLTTALEEAGGNTADAADRLGLHPSSFRRLVRRLGLKDR